MVKASIPVYDINTIDQQSHQSLLVQRLEPYLQKHYASLHRSHRHSFYHFVLFTKGSGTHTIDFEKFEVQPFQMYFMKPGQVHSWHFEGTVDGYIVHFYEELISAFLYNSHYLERFHFTRGNTKDGICQLPVPVQSRVIQIFEIMLQEAAEKKEQHMDMMRLKLLELFILVERNCFTNTNTSVPQQKLTVLRSFQQLIDKHYKELRLPKDYAELLYITPNHLNALCQDLLGKTAGDLIRERILLEAKRLLTNANMTITEIAYNLNFQDNSYFVRFFKKGVGMTPEEFRKSFLNV